jgi:probable rRNA maturation factor
VEDTNQGLVILRKKVAGLSQLALSRFVALAKRALRLQGELTVLVTGDEELRRLNRRFRGKNQPTDVLSFPAPSGLRDGPQGDVAISAEIARANAKVLGHSTADELKILVLHGVLHLAGYDHERDHGEMARKELRLRKSLGLPPGLIERNGRRRKPFPAKHAGSTPGVRTRTAAPGTSSVRTNP